MTIRPRGRIAAVASHESRDVFAAVVTPGLDAALLLQSASLDDSFADFLAACGALSSPDPISGKSGLHYAVIAKCPGDVVKEVLRVFPDAALSADHAGDLPIHDAIEAGASAEVIGLIVNANPRAFLARDSLGRLPYIRALEVGASEDAVGVLYTSLSLLATKLPVENDDDSPILTAVRTDASIEVVERMLTALPALIRTRSMKGTTALHRWAPKVNVAILRRYAEGAKLQDSFGRLPLHHLVLRRSVVKYVDSNAENVDVIVMKEKAVTYKVYFNLEAFVAATAAPGASISFFTGSSSFVENCGEERYGVGWDCAPAPEPYLEIKDAMFSVCFRPNSCANVPRGSYLYTC
jgi:ankyrin repeat protein